MKIKHFIFIIIALMLHSKIQSQEWRPFNSKWIYNYSIWQGDSLNFDISIWCDSIKEANGDSVYYLNRITTSNERFSTLYRNQSHFLQKQVIFSDNRSFHFKDPESYVILPKSNVNVSWVFDTINKIQAKVVQTTIKSIFGKNDSVKIILLSSNDTILISKSYGIIKFPNFGKRGNFHLIGIDNLSLGLTVPKQNDFINYSIDDSFEFKFFRSAPGAKDWQHYRYKITKIKIEDDKLVLWRSGSGYHFQSNSDYDPLGEPISYGSDYYINDSLVIYLKFYAFLNGYNFDLSGDGDVKTYLKISYSNEFKEFQKCFFTGDYGLMDAEGYSDTLGIALFTKQLYETYINKVGLVEEISDWTLHDASYSNYYSHLKLIACKKNDYSYGLFSNDTLFSNTKQIPQEYAEFKVYPNPSNNIISLDINTENSVYIRIFNQMGICIFDQKFNSKPIEININSFKPGIYFINCELNKCSFRAKFIKN
jgi:hypothetical protein